MYKEEIQKVYVSKEEILKLIGYDPLLVRLRNIELVIDDEVMFEVLIIR